MPVLKGFESLLDAYQRTRAYSTLSSPPASRSVATSATSSWTLSRSGTGGEGTMTTSSGLLFPKTAN